MVKTVLCQGCFDVLHVGHINHLKAAKAMGDHLVVGITADEHVQKGPGRPFNKLGDRMEMIWALECVDEVVVCHGNNAVDAIYRVQPDLYVKGAEYRDKVDPTGRIDLEQEAVESIGGKLAFTDEVTDSSTRIIDSMQLEEDLKAIHGLKVMVVGDAILDGEGGHFISKIGNSHIIINEEDVSWHPGGAEVFSLHANGLGCRTELYTNQNATKKLRMKDGTRVDILPTSAGDKDIVRGSFATKPDVAIMADFGHAYGFEYPEMDFMKAKVRAWSAQKNTANERNLQAYWHEINDHDYDLTLVVMNEYEWSQINSAPPNAQYVVVTNHKGASVKGGPFFNYNMPQDWVSGDTIGCGDALTTMMACALGAGLDIETALRMGCLAGATTTQWKLNTETICPENLIQMATRLSSR